MASSRFALSLALRLVLVGIAMALVVWLMLMPGYHSATLLACFALGLLGFSLWRFVSRSNRELARFLDAVRFGDYSQRFDFEQSGSGFPQLGRAFTRIMDEMLPL